MRRSGSLTFHRHNFKNLTECTKYILRSEGLKGFTAGEFHLQHTVLPRRAYLGYLNIG